MSFKSETGNLIAVIIHPAHGTSDSVSKEKLARHNIRRFMDCSQLVHVNKQSKKASIFHFVHSYPINGHVHNISPKCAFLYCALNVNSAQEVSHNFPLKNCSLAGTIFELCFVFCVNTILKTY